MFEHCPFFEMNITSLDRGDHAPYILAGHICDLDQVGELKHMIEFLESLRRMD